jgi:hypothetical protein
MNFGPGMTDAIVAEVPSRVGLQEHRKGSATVRYMTQQNSMHSVERSRSPLTSFSGAGRMSGKSVAKSSRSQVRRMTSRAFPSSERYCYEMLKDQPGLRPAPYLASRGMKWIQHFAKPGRSDAAPLDYIRQSHVTSSRKACQKRDKPNSDLERQDSRSEVRCQSTAALERIVATGDQRNPSLARHSTGGSLRVHFHAQARLLAQPHLLQVSPLGPAPPPGSIKTGAKGLPCETALWLIHQQRKLNDRLRT